MYAMDSEGDGSYGHLDWNWFLQITVRSFVTSILRFSATVSLFTCKPPRDILTVIGEFTGCTIGYFHPAITDLFLAYPVPRRCIISNPDPAPLAFCIPLTRNRISHIPHVQKGRSCHPAQPIVHSQFRMRSHDDGTV